jgi:prepilin-type N-terminal cleavage/methylation domain-containing protein
MRKGFNVVELMVVLAIVAVIGAVLFPIITSFFSGGSDTEIVAIEAQGYKNIEFTGYSMFGCDEKDTFRKKFIATAPNGKRVEGVACSGVMKGVTVRITGVAK